MKADGWNLEPDANRSTRVTKIIPTEFQHYVAAAGRVPDVALHGVAHILSHLFAKGFWGIAPKSHYTPFPERCRISTPSTARGVASGAASQKVSRYTGVQQLHCRVSRYTLLLSFSPVICGPDLSQVPVRRQNEFLN